MFGKKKKLLKWQSLVLQEPTSKLFLTEDQLREKSLLQINEHIEIANDCSEIVNHTNDPDTYFCKLDLLIEKLRILCEYEKYIKWGSDSPTKHLAQVLLHKEGSITSFIDRYWESICNNGDGGTNPYQTFFNTMQKYNAQMTKQNISYYSDIYQSCGISYYGTENSTTKYNNSLNGIDSELDIYFEEAGKFVIEKNKASVGMLQRMFKIGFNRAERIMDQLFTAGVVGSEEGTKPREVLMSLEEFEQLIEERISCETSSTNYRKNLDQILDEKEKHKESAHKLTDNEILQNAKNTLKNARGLIADYSRDGLMLYNLKNIIIPQATDAVQLEFIETLEKFNSPLTMQLILLDDSQITYASYNFAPQLFLPVITDKARMSGCINWLVNERDNRINRFLEYDVRNINSYNKKIATLNLPSEEKLKEMPRIVVIVNEMHTLPSDVNDELISLLLNSTKMGIYFIFFSKFTLKNIPLGAKADLLEIYDKDQLRKLFPSGSDKQENQYIQSIQYDYMNGHDFESFCAKLLSKNGFDNVTVTQGSGDQGIDIIAYKDGLKYGIQCKCYSSDIGNKAVQEAFSGKTFYGCHVAAVLTNRHFTKSAEELSDSNKVLLWDREKLEELIKNAN